MSKSGKNKRDKYTTMVPGRIDTPFIQMDHRVIVVNKTEYAARNDNDAPRFSVNLSNSVGVNAGNMDIFGALIKSMKEQHILNYNHDEWSIAVKIWDDIEERLIWVDVSDGRFLNNPGLKEEYWKYPGYMIKFQRRGIVI